MAYTPPHWKKKKVAQPEGKVWAAQAGSQVLFFLSSPVFETLYEGTRGPGKTDAKSKASKNWPR